MQDFRGRFGEIVAEAVRDKSTAVLADAKTVKALPIALSYKINTKILYSEAEGSGFPLRFRSTLLRLETRHVPPVGDPRGALSPTKRYISASSKSCCPCQDADSGSIRHARKLHEISSISPIQRLAFGGNCSADPLSIRSKSAD